MRRLRAFSLLEALVTMFLLGILLSALTTLFTGTNQLFVNTVNHEQGQAAADLALRTMTRELRAAVQVQKPIVGSASTILRIYRVDEWNPKRLPVPLETPLPSSFNPHGSYLVLEEFKLLGQALIETRTFPDGTTEEFEVTRGLSGLQFQVTAVTATSGGSANVTASYEYKGQIVPATTIVHLHRPPQVLP